MTNMANEIGKVTGIDPYALIAKISKEGISLNLDPFDLALVKLADIKKTGADIKPYVELFMLGLGSAE